MAIRRSFHAHPAVRQYRVRPEMPRGLVPRSVAARSDVVCCATQSVALSRRRVIEVTSLSMMVRINMGCMTPQRWHATCWHGKLPRYRRIIMSSEGPTAQQIGEGRSHRCQEVLPSRHGGRRLLRMYARRDIAEHYSNRKFVEASRRECLFPRAAVRRIQI